MRIYFIDAWHKRQYILDDFSFADTLTDTFNMMLDYIETFLSIIKYKKNVLEY